MGSCTVRAAMLMVVSLLLGGGGCANSGSSARVLDREPGCNGKCDGSGVYVSPYEADLGVMNSIWPGSPKIKKLTDAYSVIVKLGDKKILAPTHLFGVPVNVIPYANDDTAKDATGQSFGRGDSEIAKAFPRGSIGYGVKHHRPQYRTLDPARASDDLKEHLKLQDTHIEIVVGVQRDGAPGAVTVNNPQGYEEGRFGPTCQMVCGGFSPDLTCACDVLCTKNGDCCADYGALCPAQ